MTNKQQILSKIQSNTEIIGIIGLGYVGLPLAVNFAEAGVKTLGFDKDGEKVDNVNHGKNYIGDIRDAVLRDVVVDKLSLSATTDFSRIKECDALLICVPTPLDKFKKPDMSYIESACIEIGRHMKPGTFVCLESTTYPTTTEDFMLPIIARESGLNADTDFWMAYSPERINPGDKEHTVEKILKVTSGSTPEIGERVNELYKSVITAGTHLAPCIKVAEAAKVIENAQRDINIAFVNELAKIFNILEIDTQAVLEAAGTKWNFLNFKPGLVGGHCIGIDPYYLAQKAQEVGYHPEIILAGRRLNDSMAGYVASQVVKTMIKKGINVNNSHVLMLGITFKENCPDVRNTKIVDVIRALEEYGVNVCVYDPWANPEEVYHEYGIKPLNNINDVQNGELNNAPPSVHSSLITYLTQSSLVLLTTNFLI